MILFALTLLAAGLLIGGWQWATQRGKGRAALPSLRLALLPVLGLGLQFLALRSAGGWERLTLFALSQVLLLLFFAVNFQSAPLRLLALGFALNLLPMVANCGYMPITPEAVAQLYPQMHVEQLRDAIVRVGSKDVILPAAQAPFWFLGDVFVLGSPFPLPTAFSLGDIIILIGFGWAVYRFSLPVGANHEPHRTRALGQRGSSG